MNTEYKLADRSDDRLVYVKPVALSELPKEVREQAGDVKQLFEVVLLFRTGLRLG
tara:strand:- start:4 stop:168 length:165 start_codon:yes stop_codon:yes gene_type:complete